METKIPLELLDYNTRAKTFFKKIECETLEEFVDYCNDSKYGINILEMHMDVGAKTIANILITTIVNGYRIEVDKDNHKKYFHKI